MLNLLGVKVLNKVLSVCSLDVSMRWNAVFNANEQNKNNKDTFLIIIYKCKLENL